MTDEKMIEFEVNGKKHYPSLICSNFCECNFSLLPSFQIFELCHSSEDIEGIVFSSML
jgi:hypothetical protein